MNSYRNKINLKNISKSFNDMEILRDITIDVNEGELVSIIGPSGSGKSTIFNIIVDLIKADNGVKNIHGKVSYMYQRDMMVPWKRVIDNVALPLVLKGMKRKDAREKVKEYISTFGLEGFEYKYPSQLSGGMKQRANFLKTYLTSSDIMLLDEPFGALDSITRRNLQKWLLTLNAEMKSTILFITHDIEEAIYLSDKVYVMSEKPAKIKGTVNINLGNNREESIIVSDEFMKIKKEIFHLMNS